MMTSEERVVDGGKLLLGTVYVCWAELLLRRTRKQAERTS